MYVARGVVLLVLLTAGCDPVTPETQPSVVETKPDEAEPTAHPTLPTTAPAVHPTTPARPAPPAPPAPPAASAAIPPPIEPVVASPVANGHPTTPMLDLTTLKQQLRETKAIGVLTKIALKNQVDDLLDQFREYYLGTSKLTMAGLRQSYELLMMKVLSLLQDEDQQLASAISASREAIWAMLSDSKKFAALQG